MLLSKVSYNCSYTNSHTTAESTTQGDSQLVRKSWGEVSCSGTPHHSLGGAGMELATIPVTQGANSCCDSTTLLSVKVFQKLGHASIMPTMSEATIFVIICFDCSDDSM